MRSAIVGNGRLTALFDGDYYLRDLYFPYVGRYNHAFGGVFKVGVWHDGRFAWLESMEKEVAMDGLVARMTARWDGLEIAFEDFVELSRNALIRRVDIEGPGLVRVIFYHDFRIMEAPQADTAVYDPQNDAVIHYKGDFWFLAGSSHQLYEYTVGRRDQGVLEDCEDGSLAKNPVAQGSVASAISIAYPKFYYWIIAGRSYREVVEAHLELRARPQYYEARNKGYWRAVVERHPRRLLAQSVAVLMAHMGDNGAIAASLDTDILKFNLDTYAYLWPRDASFVAAALDELGYTALTKKFYELGLQLLAPYFQHKYNVDGTLGSSWHPWTARSKKSLNIQEDETATFLWALWRYFEKASDYDLLKRAYPRVRDAADFLARFRDERLGLPLESYDLWEERLGVHTYTAASVYAGLKAAAKFAGFLGEEEDAERWLKAAEEVKAAMLNYMFDKALGHFVRTVRIDDGKIIDVDKALDASLLGISIFGVFEPDDPHVVSTVKAVESALWVKTVGGLARYEGDLYQRVPGDYSGIPGNPWIITTMWLAQYYAALGDLAKAEDLIGWAESAASPAGLLPEQVSPFDKSPVSVQPLAWSHAEYIRALVAAHLV
jgi:GH15 family glucan-1,4-alpha-glucosidase